MIPGWTYRPADLLDVVEFGTVGGPDVALSPHFHDEDQLTIVLAGRRRFVLGREVVAVEAGGCVMIPAGIVHRSLAEPAGVEALNLYLPGGEYAAAAIATEVERLWRDAGGPPTNLDLATIVAAHRGRRQEIAPRPILPRRGVAALAREAGMSREGFSRAFARRHGMPPHAFGLVVRLNDARRLLRSGLGIAAAAAEAGFADQSHLGRCFRRAFGVSPGQYRRGGGGSRTFQTSGAER